MSRRRWAFVGAAGLLAFSLVGPWIYRVDPSQLDLSLTLAAPSSSYPLGTDESGRDVLARLMMGGRVTLAVGLLAGVVALTLGTILGGLSASRRRSVELAAGRTIDAALAVPAFFVSLVVLALFGTSLLTLVLAIGATAWMGIARLVRAEALSVRERDFVAAAQALGSGPLRTFLRHVLPQLRSTLSAAAAVGVAQAILTESALSFLGLGVQPPRPSWGNMLTAAQQNLSARPGIAVLPGLMVVLTVVVVNALGEQARGRIDA